MPDLELQIAPTPEFELELDGRQGIAGPPGESAYHIAVRHGFDGTEEEWLKSLNPNAELIDPTLPHFVEHWILHG